MTVYRFEDGCLRREVALSLVEHCTVMHSKQSAAGRVAGAKRPPPIAQYVIIIYAPSSRHLSSFIMNMHHSASFIMNQSVAPFWLKVPWTPPIFDPRPPARIGRGVRARLPWPKSGVCCGGARAVASAGHRAPSRVDPGCVVVPHV